MSFPPNIHVDYVDAESGKVVGSDAFYDPGYWWTPDMKHMPAYRCGRLIGLLPHPDDKRGHP